MKALRPTTYQTVDEVDAIVREREAEAELLPSGAEKQAVLLAIAKLRAYAEVKRWLAEHPPAAKPGRNRRHQPLANPGEYVS